MPPRYQIPNSGFRLALRADPDKHNDKPPITHKTQRPTTKKDTQANFESTNSSPHDVHPLVHGYKQNKFDTDETSMSDVPVPIPDTGVHHSSVATHGYSQSATATIHGPLSSISPHAITTTSAYQSGSSLPVTAPSSILSTSSQPSFSTLPANTAQLSSPTGLHLSTLAISLLASGSACVVICIIIIVKVCTRPRRRTPTPSLPILTEGFEDTYKPDLEDSPLFGGKERTSHQDFIWPQYPQPIQLPSESVQAQSRGIGDTSNAYTQNRQPQVQQCQEFIFPRQPIDQAYAPIIASPKPIRQMQGAVTRAARRLSTLSLSTHHMKESYDGHQQTSAASSNDDPPFTADGHQVMERNKSRASVRKSMHDDSQPPTSTSRRRSLSHRQSQQQSLAYDGADIMTPHVQLADSSFVTPIAIATPSAAHGGRSRIKSSYFTSYPRTSGAPVVASTSTANFNSSEAPEVPLQRSASRRHRDTRALAAALGLGSPSPICPPPPSPQPTVYPDDSLSMASPSSRRISKKAFLSRTGDRAADSHTRPTSAFSPTLDASSVLGNLMLMEYGTSKSLANLNRLSTETRQSYASGKPSASSSARNLYHDRPPRVPSPPPLPSLAQMGLEKTMPEAFANYRSPTYSIFGLYETDDKKKRISVGR